MCENRLGITQLKKQISGLIWVLLISVSLFACIRPVSAAGQKSKIINNKWLSLKTVDIEYKIKNTDITLIPYFLTGSKQSGPRTYFKCK